jgi:hypothetical protein
MKFFKTAEYTLLGHKRNKDIFEKLQVEVDDEKLKDTNQIGYDM